MISDFLIGDHAMAHTGTLLTLDRGYYTGISRFGSCLVEDY